MSLIQLLPLMQCAHPTLAPHCAARRADVQRSLATRTIENSTNRQRQSTRQRIANTSLSLFESAAGCFFESISLSRSFICLSLVLCWHSFASRQRETRWLPPPTTSRSATARATESHLTSCIRDDSCCHHHRDQQQNKAPCQCGSQQIQCRRLRLLCMDCVHCCCWCGPFTPFNILRCSQITITQWHGSFGPTCPMSGSPNSTSPTTPTSIGLQWFRCIL
jgi:hypothetical protein